MKPPGQPPGTQSTDMYRGALYMTAAAFCFSIMNALVRMASADLPPLEVAFFRNLFALAAMVPWMVSSGATGLRTRFFRIHLTRAVISVCSMGLWFTSVALVPLAEAVALNFTLPIFIVAGAALVLGEKVGLRRWSAVMIGFLGMLVILRPGIADVSPVMVLPVAAAVLMAVSGLILKHMSARDSAGTNVLYLNLLMTPLSLGPALLVWVWPSWQNLVLLAALGVLAMLAHLALARAFTVADASAVMPFDYARLPFIAVFAFFLFGEVPEVWTWIGAAIIAGSALYIARRESLLARAQNVEPPPPPPASGI